MVEALTLNFSPDLYKILKPFSINKKTITKKILVNILSNLLNKKAEGNILKKEKVIK
ncbi:MAG: hypothetical protein Ta2D_13560 [Rickettsiales bacterium]|nr:MAG: hypothetical protein Ta2D_13560 [Rickettsiales bacterium]